MAPQPARHNAGCMQTFDSRLALRLGATVACALVVAVATGGIAASVVWTGMRPENTGDLSALGPAMAAAGAGILTAVVGYTAATVVGVSRVVARGRRAATVAALLAAPPFLVTATDPAGAGAFEPLAALGFLGFLVAIAVGVLGLSGALAHTPAVRPGGAPRTRPSAGRRRRPVASGRPTD